MLGLKLVWALQNLDAMKFCLELVNLFDVVKPLPLLTMLDLVWLIRYMHAIRGGYPLFPLLVFLHCYSMADLRRFGTNRLPLREPPRVMGATRPGVSPGSN